MPIFFVFLRASPFSPSFDERGGYLLRNPVKRGLVKEPGDWKWSGFRHYAFRENGVAEFESEWTARDRELKMFGGQARIFLSPEPALSLSKG
jgi:hypothetical protein